MKKIATLFFLLMVLTLTACSDKTPDTSEKMDTSSKPSTNTPVEESSLTPEEQTKKDEILSKLPPLEELYFQEDVRSYAKEMIGTKAPLFTLSNVNGSTISLDDYKGQKVILEMAQTTCHVCEEMQPILNDFKQAHSDIAFLQAFPLESSDTVKSFLTKTNSDINDQVIVGNSPNNLFESYKVKFTPILLFIDEEGYIQLIFVGSTTQEVLDLYTELAFS